MAICASGEKILQEATGIRRGQIYIYIQLYSPYTRRWKGIACMMTTVTSPTSRPVLPFTVIWLWYAPGSIVCRVCSTDAFTADVDYQLLIVCMVACRPEPDVLNFSHIVIDIQYTFIIHYLHINVNRPHHFIILSLSLSFPNASSYAFYIVHNSPPPPALIAAGRLGAFFFWLRPSQPNCRLSDARRATSSSFAAVRFRYRKYITYRNDAGGGPSHGHKQHAQKVGKDRACGSGAILADRQTHTHTDMLITILRNYSSARSNKRACASTAVVVSYRQKSTANNYRNDTVATCYHSL